jgi:DNA-binding transcriptional regulator YiaG
MGKIETIVKGEIVRLARREIRPLVGPLQRQVRTLTRAVKTLIADTRRLAGTAKRLEASRIDHVARLSVPEAEAKAARMSPGLIKKLRNRIKVTQQQLAVLVGVSAAAVQSWEQGIARPGGENRVALAALRKLGRRDVAALLSEKGISKPGRKPRTMRAKPAAKKKRGRKPGRKPGRKAGKARGAKGKRKKVRRRR